MEVHPSTLFGIAFCGMTHSYFQTETFMLQRMNMNGDVL